MQKETYIMSFAERVVFRNLVLKPMRFFCSKVEKEENVKINRVSMLMHGDGFCHSVLQVETDTDPMIVTDEDASNRMSKIFHRYINSENSKDVDSVILSLDIPTGVFAVFLSRERKCISQIKIKN